MNEEENAADLKQARKFWSRAYFAWFVTTIFVAGLAGYYWTWALLFMVGFLIAVRCIVAFSSEGATFLNWILVKPFIPTNNRWEAWTVLFFLISLGVLIFLTPWGRYQAWETSRNYALELNQKTARDLTARKRYWEGSATGESKPEPPNAIQNISPTLEESAPADPWGYTRWVRIITTLLLFLLALVYLGVSRWDEFENLLKEARNKAKEKAEGIDVKQVATVAAPVVVAATTQGAQSATKAFAEKAAEHFSFDVASNLIFSFFKRLFQEQRARSL